MESSHPIEGLMKASMSSIQDMVDVNTIIGDPIETVNNTVIIPISKVSFGFAAGGSEFNEETVEEYLKKDKDDEEIKYKLPFGGGSGAGVSINPVAFIVVQEGNVKLLPVSYASTIDKVLDYIPDLLHKMGCKIETKENKKEDISDILNIDKKEKKKEPKPKKQKEVKEKVKTNEDEEQYEKEEYEVEYIEDEDLDD